MEKKTETLDNLSWAIFISLIFLDIFIWKTIFLEKAAKTPEVYFLDVGQGDSELLILKSGIKILTDAGPNKKVLRELGKIPSLKDRYIDLAVISHPQLDHFGGFNEIIDYYDIGAFLINGRVPDSEEILSLWNSLFKKIEKKNIPVITLGEGDSVKFMDNRIDFLSPHKNWLGSAELNDTSLVEFITTPEFKMFLGGDIGFNVEKYLVEKFNLDADILKVSHHGSKYSSSVEFLKEVSPVLAVIEVGNNKYGHPAKETLDRFISLGIRVVRTDKNKTIKLLAESGKIKVFADDR